MLQSHQSAQVDGMLCDQPPIGHSIYNNIKSGGNLAKVKGTFIELTVGSLLAMILSNVDIVFKSQHVVSVKWN